MNDAGENAGSRTYGHSRSAADIPADLSADTVVTTMIPDHGATPLGALGRADPGTVRRLLPSSRSQGPGFNSNI